MMEENTNAIVETTIKIKVPLTEEELAEFKKMDEVELKARTLILKELIKPDLGVDDDELEVSVRLLEEGAN